MDESRLRGFECLKETPPHEGVLLIRAPGSLSDTSHCISVYSSHSCTSRDALRLFRTVLEPASLSFDAPQAAPCQNEANLPTAFMSHLDSTIDELHAAICPYKPIPLTSLAILEIVLGSVKGCVQLHAPPSRLRLFVPEEKQ